MTNNHFLGKLGFVMEEIFEKKCDAIKKKFAPLTPEERYRVLMEMGRDLPPFPEEEKKEENVVKGCQSRLYLLVQHTDGKLFFNAQTDALISAGLAALLIAVYSGEPPQTILTQPPRFLAELGIHATLSPSRSNGLANIHLRMKQEALKVLV